VYFDIVSSKVRETFEKSMTFLFTPNILVQLNDPDRLRHDISMVGLSLSDTFKYAFTLFKNLK